MITEQVVAYLRGSNRDVLSVCHYGAFEVDGQDLRLNEESRALFPCGEMLWAEDDGRLRVGQREWDLQTESWRHEYLNQSADGVAWDTMSLE